MKFISWNVNGLRACVGKGFAEAVNALDPDFLCLQETKLQAGQIDHPLPGYMDFWNYAEKKGYSGTAIFARQEPLSVTYGIGIPELDTEGRLITLEYENFYLVTCYTPNSQQELARLPHRLTWDEAFRNYLSALDKSKPVIACGDLNVAATAMDLKNPKSNENNAGYSLPERESFAKLLNAGFTDSFRHLYPEKILYSWWSYRFQARAKNAGWRIDYFLVSDSIKEHITQADILTEIQGSDHCPVTLEIDL